MSAKSDFLRGEGEKIEKTASLIKNLLDREHLNKYEVIALGTLLQDVYMGIERILRCRLEDRKITIDKTPQWHKNLLLRARDESMISEVQFEAFGRLLLFRHLHVHGYGYDLDEKRLRQLAAQVPDLCRDFLSGIK